MNKNLIKYVKENLNASDAEIEYTIEEMVYCRIPCSVANEDLYDRICGLIDEYAEENGIKVDYEWSDIDEIIWEL